MGSSSGPAGHGEARADHNAHYGSEPGIKFYTHVYDRFAPFYTKVIAANASEAAYVLDGLASAIWPTAGSMSPTGTLTTAPSTP